jgi:hypothetical protein
VTHEERGGGVPVLVNQDDQWEEDDEQQGVERSRWLEA